MLVVARRGDRARARARLRARSRALTDVRGVYVTAAGDDGTYDIVSRCFAPRVGIDEDPVTGSMHCVLRAYWCERLGKTELHALPGVGARRRDARVASQGDRTLLTGQRRSTVLAGRATSTERA